MSSPVQVGEVVAVKVYPVKSMAGCPLSAAHLGWQGLDGDRRYAFTRTGSLNGLPWVSARQLPALVAYQASFEEPDRIRRSAVEVVSPEGVRYVVNSPQLASEISAALGSEVHLMHLHRGTFDTMPLSIITTGSIRTISADVGADVAVERFRANVVIDAVGARAFPEEKWVGRSLVFGDSDDPARIQVNRKDERCSIVNLDPATGRSNLALHRLIVERRRNFLGVYGSTERPGTLAVGDAVYLRQRSEKT